VRLLFDTQLWIWLVEGSPKLSAEARKTFADDNNTIVWSVVSLWEVAIKTALGRQGLSVGPDELLTYLRVGNFEELPVLAEHVLPLMHLAHNHADPFDRLLVAQATAEGMTLLTADRTLARYGAVVRVV
jgi:PIN domain nuclease of toxin-antitoxin system